MWVLLRHLFQCQVLNRLRLVLSSIEEGCYLLVFVDSLHVRNVVIDWQAIVALSSLVFSSASAKLMDNQAAWSSAFLSYRDGLVWSAVTYLRRSRT